MTTPITAETHASQEPFLVGETKLREYLAYLHVSEPDDEELMDRMVSKIIDIGRKFRDKRKFMWIPTRESTVDHVVSRQVRFDPDKDTFLFGKKKKTEWKRLHVKSHTFDQLLHHLYDALEKQFPQEIIRVSVLGPDWLKNAVSDGEKFEVLKNFQRFHPRSPLSGVPKNILVNRPVIDQESCMYDVTYDLLTGRVGGNRKLSYMVIRELKEFFRESVREYFIQGIIFDKGSSEKAQRFIDGCQPQLKFFGLNITSYIGEAKVPKHLQGCVVVTVE